ncbi:GntR family transcriptional regulator [Alicyclobacillus sp. ALC3]|uniref:GntR family transcriptional regulator n=1 Tax=Alicyclobacillus sp. ALC3 TaxID=2796143 RepID=UPI002378296F|nr:GntR family transcriptional regulator [Alicyclobacillus sp. ALC3]WDL98435.1 GntR family transcriptional regulator [Alicyclobacillus sp. ALC3]
MHENNRIHKKAARYATAYNQLLNMIQDGLYPEGSKFPTEPILAQQLGISRSTLRQALRLLIEDGVLEARRGVGNFVRKTLNLDNVGIERMGNPFYSSCLDSIDKVDIDVEVDLSSEHTKRVFNRNIPVILAVYRYYKENGVVRGSCFSHVATDFDQLKSIDLNDQGAVLEYLETKIYEDARSSMVEIKLVRSTDNIKEAIAGATSEYYQMIAERLTDVNGNIIAYSKYYIPFERAVFKVFRNN